MFLFSGVSFVDVALLITLLIFAVKKKKNPHTWSIIGTIILVLLIIQGLLRSPISMIKSIILGLIIYFGMKKSSDMKGAPGSKNTSNQKKAHMRNDSKHPLLDQYKREHGM